MQEILDIFLEKSKQHHSNIIYAQIYKNDLLKEEFRLFPVKTRLNIWSISKPFVAMAAGIAEREGLITLDEYIYPWFEKYFPSDPSENLYKIKIRDLLTMSSGHTFCCFSVREMRFCESLATTSVSLKSNGLRRTTSSL